LITHRYAPTIAILKKKNKKLEGIVCKIGSEVRTSVLMNPMAGLLCMGKDASILAALFLACLARNIPQQPRSNPIIVLAMHYPLKLVLFMHSTATQLDKFFANNVDKIQGKMLVPENSLRLQPAAESSNRYEDMLLVNIDSPAKIF